MTKGRDIVARRQPWTEQQEKLLARLYPDTPTAKIAERLGCDIERVYAKAHAMGLKKSAAYMESPAACRLRRGDEVGKPFRYPKGHVPANKGLRRPGYAPGRMAETQFKKGQRNHNFAPIGSDRLSKEGYMQVKLTETGYPPRDWVAVHQLVWQLHRGPIPAGHHVSFKDGDRTHIEIANLELVSRAEMMRRNTVHNLPKPVVEVVQLRAALVRKINRATKGATP